MWNYSVYLAASPALVGGDGTFDQLSEFSLHQPFLTHTLLPYHTLLYTILKLFFKTVKQLSLIVKA